MSRSFRHQGKRWDSRSTLSNTTQWERERMRGPIQPMLEPRKPGFWRRLWGGREHTTP